MVNEHRMRITNAEAEEIYRGLKAIGSPLARRFAFVKSGYYPRERLWTSRARVDNGTGIRSNNGTDRKMEAEKDEASEH